MPSWHCRCKNGLRKASPPKNLPFSLPGVLLSCADATQCFPARPWGWVGAASARGLALPVQSWPQKGLSAPNTSHFHLQHAPLMCWRHTMLSWTTWGWVGAASAQGKGPAVACTRKLKVGCSTWFLVDNLCFIHKQLLQKEIVWAEIGVKQPNFGQNHTLRWALSCTIWYCNFGRP